MISTAERRFRRVLLVSALIMVFLITLGFGWTMLSILDNLKRQRVEASENTERLVQNQTDIIRHIALTNRDVTRKSRRQIRASILKLEEDLRVLLAAVGGDPSDIPPQPDPEPSGANNPTPSHNDGNDGPDPKPTPKPTPKPSPTEDPLVCLPPPVGCIPRP